MTMNFSKKASPDTHSYKIEEWAPQRHAEGRTVDRQAIAHEDLIYELMDPNVPKLPREHAAVREIERLRGELKMMQDSARDLIEVIRMPNIEHVADAHNAAVHLLQRTGEKK